MSVLHTSCSTINENGVSVLIVFSACGGIRTSSLSVLTAYFPVLAIAGILGKGLLVCLCGLLNGLTGSSIQGWNSVADCQATT